MGSRRVQGVALLAGLLRAINKRCCQHPPLDPRLFSSSPPLSLYICVYICIYIFFCLFSSRSFFSYFFHFTLFFSPLILSRSFFPHTCLFSRKFIVSLSLSFSPAVWNSFQSINSFPKSIVFFSPFFSLSAIFFSLSVSRELFSLYLPELDFSGFLLDQFYVPNDFSDSSFKIVLPSLSVRIQGISLSIFPVDSSRNRLDFRPLPSPKLSRIPPLATLSLSFVPPLGIFTSSFESLRAL